MEVEQQTSAVDYDQEHIDEVRISLNPAPNDSMNAYTKQFYAKTIVLMLLIGWSSFVFSTNKELWTDIWRDPAFTIFCCIGELIVLQALFGVCMLIWNICGIDYLRILSLEGTELIFDSPDIDDGFLGTLIDTVQREQRGYAEGLVLSSAQDNAIFLFLTFVLFNECLYGSLVDVGPTDLSIAHVLPVCLFLYSLYHIIFPWRFRSVWINMIKQVILAPFYQVQFRDGYIGDILTSTVRVSIQLSFSILYSLIILRAIVFYDQRLADDVSITWWNCSSVLKEGLVPILTIGPLFIRLLQCLRRAVETGARWPHYANALKYTSSISVISFGVFNRENRKMPIWIFSFVFATLFQFLWDITMDWGLVVVKEVDENEGSLYIGPINICRYQISLRSPLLIGPTWLYIALMVFNFVLRFSWMLTLMQPPELHGIVSLQCFAERANLKEFDKAYYIFFAYMGPIITVAEIFRRMIWGIFRLEYEQLCVFGDPRSSSEPPIFTKMNLKLHSNIDRSINERAPTSASKVEDSLLFKIIPSADKDWTKQYSSTVSIISSLSMFETLRNGSKLWVPRLLESTIFFTLVLIIVVVAAFSST